MKKLWKQMISMLLAVTMLAGSAPRAGAVNDINGECLAASVGSSIMAVVKTDGSLWTWGANNFGQLGHGTITEYEAPAKVMDDVKFVVVEHSHSAAIKTDGSLWTWGDNGSGQLGDGTMNNHDKPVKIMDNVITVSVGSQFTAAIKVDGSLWAWGTASILDTGVWYTTEQLWKTPTKIMDNIVAVSAGADYIATIKTDGSLWTWGNNKDGQLGDGTTESSSTPIKIMDDVKSISANWGHTSAIKTDGSLWTWGNNKYGQLGDGTTINRNAPIKVMDSVAMVSSGNGNTAAIKTDGSLWTWGCKSYGQLGDGTLIDRGTPVQIMSDIHSVDVGHNATIATKQDGSLWFWGYNTLLEPESANIDQLTPIKLMSGVRVDTTGVTLEPSTPTEPETPPYIYDEADPADNLDFSDILSDATDQQTAEKAIEDGVSQMTPEQKSSPMGVDKATLLAEEVAACVNVQPLSNGSLNLKRESASAATRTAVTAAEKVLNKNGIETQRVPRAIQTYDAGDNKKISVQNEVLSGDVDQIRVKTSFASATTSAKRANNFTMEDRGNKTVEVKFNTNTDNLVTVSFPGISADDKYMAVVDENGNPVGGKYNPVTGTLEAKLTASGIYRVVNNEKDFADIKSKSKEMQNAIKLLASKGVINGTSETTFAPDSTISRAEIAALLMRTLSLLDPNANGGFTDVTSANWFYGAAGSAKKHNIISGFEDNTFRGLNVIAKNQIVAVAARTLRQQMNYKTPSDIAKELAVYGDDASIESWAKEDIALATMCNLVMKRTDGNFGGTANMTRGDAAIIIKRLFDKLW